MSHKLTHNWTAWKIPSTVSHKVTHSWTAWKIHSTVSHKLTHNWTAWKIPGTMSHKLTHNWTAWKIPGTVSHKLTHNWTAWKIPGTMSHKLTHNLTAWKIPGIFSCDQAALQMVYSVCPSVRLSVRPSVCLSHLFDYVPIIVSSWNFQELLPMTKVRSMQKVKVRGQRSRSQRSQPNLTVSGL